MDMQIRVFLKIKKSRSSLDEVRMDESQVYRALTPTRLSMDSFLR